MTLIVLSVALVTVVALLVWLSLSMAAAEGAIGRVTRANLNNRIFEVQTDPDTNQFTTTKKIRRIHQVQRFIANRYATAGSCAFFRITCNVLSGVFVAIVAGTWGASWWIELLVGVVFAFVVAVVSILVRPRETGVNKPTDIMIKHARLVNFAVAVTPFARVGTSQDGRRRRDLDLSDDEELEKIQLEQGRAAIDRMVESNEFDPEVSEMMRNVLMLSETLTREIMVPRTDMITIECDASLEDMLKLCSRSGFSRVPVIGEDVDDLVGIAYLKDAVRATAFNPAAMSRDVASIVRDPMLVPNRSRWMTCSTRCSDPANTWPSSWTNTAASPAWSPSKTPSNRSWANWKMSTIVHSTPSPRRSATANGACPLEPPSRISRNCTRSISTRTTWTRYTDCSPNCSDACPS